MNRVKFGMTFSRQRWWLKPILFVLNIFIYTHELLFCTLSQLMKKNLLRMLCLYFHAVSKKLKNHMHQNKKTMMQSWLSNLKQSNCKSGQKSSLSYYYSETFVFTKNGSIHHSVVVTVNDLCTNFVVLCYSNLNLS